MDNLNNEEKEDLSEDSVSADETAFAYKTVIKGKQNSRIYSIISVSFSALSILLCFFPWLALMCGALGILFAIISRKNLGYFDNISLAGLIIGIFGTVFSIMGLIFVYALENTEFYKNFVKSMNYIKNSISKRINL